MRGNEATSLLAFYCLNESIARTLGLTQSVLSEIKFHVTATFSYSNLHDVTNSITEIPEVGVQLPEWWITLLLYVRQYVCLTVIYSGETVAHATSNNK